MRIFPIYNPFWLINGKIQKYMFTLANPQFHSLVHLERLNPLICKRKFKLPSKRGKGETFLVLWYYFRGKYIYNAMHRHRNNLVKLGNLGRVYGFLQDWNKILESGVIWEEKFSDLKKLFRNSFKLLANIFAPTKIAEMKGKIEILKWGKASDDSSRSA